MRKKQSPLNPAPTATLDLEAVPAAATSSERFPIVGIGASAGGLEACEQFFQALPADTGLAYVLVTHLDPDHVSVLAEILQRSTAMPVSDAVDQMPVAPNHVYVIPPNREMQIFHGLLQLSMPEVARGHRMPIDTFLRSLAEDQAEYAVGIILSGTGTDGTLGLRAILGAGGVTLVQEPTSAKYDGMPQSALRAGFASHSLPVEHMAGTLQSIARNLAANLPAPVTPVAAADLNRLLLLLRSLTGHDFSLYKKTTIQRRVERRMALHELTDAAVYMRYLKEHVDEAQALMKEFLINVTSFFRDPEAFAALQTEALPALLADKPDDYVFRVWIAACSSGEEAYSVAMVLRELLDAGKHSFKVQIYATDLDDDAVAIARAGAYPPNVAADITPERLMRFFIKDKAGYRVKKDIREMIVFATQDVIKDPPFTRLDLLCCRNLMIYLEPELQNRLIPLFHFALKPGGVLFLSPSEGTGGFADLFAPLSRKWKLYQALHSKATGRAALTLAAPAKPPRPASRGTGSAQKSKDVDFAELTRRMLLRSYAPASVVTDIRGNILFVHGETGRFLRPAPGVATLNVVDMARMALQAELRLALQIAANQGLASIDRRATLEADGATQQVSISVRPLADADASQKVLLVSFEEVTPVRRRRSKRLATGAFDQQMQDLKRELEGTRDNLQATIESQQASNEELKSTNEELQSTNEELQSTNEELETSKEELQSVNEELITVNSELQAKIEQLAHMQNDMKNLLENISIGTIFLDQNLAIRRYTREATQIYRLAPADIGRPLADIRSDAEGADLLDDARQVLRTHAPCEREVRLSGGAWYLLRTQPYRTLDDVMDGVVLTFADISARVAAQAIAQSAGRLAESLIDTIREPLLVLDGELKVVSASRAFYQQFLTTPASTVGQHLYDLGSRQWDIPALRELLGTILPRDQVFDNFCVEHDFPGIGQRKMLLNARRVVRAGGQTPLILLALEPLPV